MFVSVFFYIYIVFEHDGRLSSFSLTWFLITMDREFPLELFIRLMTLSVSFIGRCASEIKKTEVEFSCLNMFMK